MNEVPVRAAALTFTTMLALVPFIILLSSVAGWLGYLHLLSRFVPYLAQSLNLNLPMDEILASIRRAQRIGFHGLGIWGTLGLLVTFFLSMGNVESAVNHVWNLRRERYWYHRIWVYVPFLLLLIALVVSGVLLLLNVRHGLERWEATGAVPVLRFHGLSLLFGALGLMIFIWVEMALIIRILPNTKVKTRPALLGATVATLIIYLLSRALFLFPRLLLAQNRLFYGSLALFPVALLLTYVFWAAALFGASVAFMHQRFHSAADIISNPEPVLKTPRRPRHTFWQKIMREVEAIYSKPKT